MGSESVNSKATMESESKERGDTGHGHDVTSQGRDVAGSEMRSSTRNLRYQHTALPQKKRNNRTDRRVVVRGARGYKAVWRRLVGPEAVTDP